MAFNKNLVIYWDIIFQFHAEVELAQGPIVPKEGKVVESKAYHG